MFRPKGRVLCYFGLNTGIEFAYFGLKSGMVLGGTRRVYERICLSIPKE